VRLKSKVLLLFGATSVLIVLVFGGITYRRLWDERLAFIDQSVAQQVRGFEFALSSFFTDVAGDVSALAENEVVRSRDDRRFTSFLRADEGTFKYDYSEPEKEIIQVLNSHRLTHRYVSSVYMGRENGAFVRSHPRERPTRYDPRERPWYTLAKASPGEVLKTPAYASVTSSDVNIGVVKALLDPHGTVYGVVGIDVTLANLTDYLLGFKIRPSGNVLLLEGDGIILASQERGLQGKNVAEYSPSLASMLKMGDATGASLDVGGRRNLVFSRKVAGEGWRIAVLVPAADINRDIRRSVLWTVLSLCGGLALLSVFTLSGLQLLVIRPLGRLTRETDVITQTGSLDRRIDIASHDELGDLAESFNEMVRSLGQSQNSLREAKKDLTDYRDHLEELVKQRTQEVESTLRELGVAKERAEAADRLKSAFLATMSHELRTPLNSIIGFTGIILQGLAGPLHPEQRKQLEMVRESARHLLALIGDVLDISKIEAGQLEVRNDPFELQASVAKVTGIVRPLAEKKGLTLQVELPSESCVVVSDARRVEQVLLNLLNNAVKFTERGGVTLMAEVGPDGRHSSPSALRVSIADTGVGIKPEDLGQLFQPFRQIDAGLSRQHEGTGLGLAICRRLADLLGGEVHAASEWGRGSIFTLTLPMRGPGES
jgi:signal transduction histidine kinase